MSGIRALRKLLPPPARPSETSPECGWQSVEESLRVVLPEDYKQFIDTYGTGAVDNFLWVLNPFSHKKHLNLVPQVEILLDALRQLQQGVWGPPEDIPYGLYPEPNGLFPWAVTDNGDVLYWLYRAQEMGQVVIVNESRGPTWRAYQIGTTDFFVALLGRGLVVDVFPNDFPSETPKFFPLAL